MGRFFQATVPQLLKDTIYKPNIELQSMINKQKIVNQGLRDQINSFISDIQIDSLDFQEERDLASKIASGYNEEINDLAKQMMDNEDFDYSTKARDIRKRMTESYTKGDWSGLRNRKAGWEKMLENNKSLKEDDPLTYNLMMQAKKDELISAAQQDPSSTFEGGQWYGRPDKKKIEELLKNIKADYLKTKKITEKDLYTRSDKEVHINKIYQTAYSALRADPQYAGYVNQMGNYLGLPGYTNEVVGEDGKISYEEVSPFLIEDGDYVYDEDGNVQLNPKYGFYNDLMSFGQAFSYTERERLHDPLPQYMMKDNTTGSSSGSSSGSKSSKEKEVNVEDLRKARQAVLDAEKAVGEAVTTEEQIQAKKNLEKAKNDVANIVDIATKHSIRRKSFDDINSVLDINSVSGRESFFMDAQEDVLQMIKDRNKKDTFDKYDVVKEQDVKDIFSGIISGKITNIEQATVALFNKMYPDEKTFLKNYNKYYNIENPSGSEFDGVGESLLGREVGGKVYKKLSEAAKAGNLHDVIREYEDMTFSFNTPKEEVISAIKNKHVKGSPISEITTIGDMLYDVVERELNNRYELRDPEPLLEGATESILSMMEGAGKNEFIFEQISPLTDSQVSEDDSQNKAEPKVKIPGDMFNNTLVGVEGAVRSLGQSTVNVIVTDSNGIKYLAYPKSDVDLSGRETPANKMFQILSDGIGGKTVNNKVKMTMLDKKTAMLSKALNNFAVSGSSDVAFSENKNESINIVSNEDRENYDVAITKASQGDLSKEELYNIVNNPLFNPAHFPDFDYATDEKLKYFFKREGFIIDDDSFIGTGAKIIPAKNGNTVSYYVIDEMGNMLLPNTDNIKKITDLLKKIKIDQENSKTVTTQ